jgi:hypothetical protein
MGFSPCVLSALEMIEIEMAQELECYVDWLESLKIAPGDPLPVFPKEAELFSIADFPEIFSWSLLLPDMFKPAPFLFAPRQVLSLGMALPTVDCIPVWAPVVRGDTTAVESLATEIRGEEGRCRLSLPHRSSPHSASPPAPPAAITFRRSSEPIRILLRALKLAQATNDIFSSVKCVRLSFEQSCCVDFPFPMIKYICQHFWIVAWFRFISWR